MREILFRGKCKHGYDYSNGDGWIYGSLLSSDETESKEVGIIRDEDLEFKNLTDDGYSTINDFGYIPVISETVGQFTGRIDKNKNRIFEGDLVINKAMHGKMWMVEYRTDTEYVGYVLKEIGTNNISIFTSWNYIEIIGNIHDNKGLLS